MAQKVQKPFLKWVGGKTQIIESIISKVPAEMNNYHDIFWEVVAYCLPSYLCINKTK